MTTPDIDHAANLYRQAIDLLDAATDATPVRIDREVRCRNEKCARGRI